jgi:hypothetical protein
LVTAEACPSGGVSPEIIDAQQHNAHRGRTKK